MCIVSCGFCAYYVGDFSLFENKKREEESERMNSGRGKTMKCCQQINNIHCSTQIIAISCIHPLGQAGMSHLIILT